MTLSKRIMDEGDTNQEMGKDYYNQGKDVYRNDYYKEEAQINDEGEPREYEESRRIINKRVRDYGDNYKYFERNENMSPLKVTETKQRRRGPIHVYRDEYYETKNEDINKYNYYPIRIERKITRYDKNQDYDEYENY